MTKREDQSQGFLPTKQNFAFFLTFLIIFVHFGFSLEKLETLSIHSASFYECPPSQTPSAGCLPSLKQFMNLYWTQEKTVWLSCRGECRLFWACSSLPGRDAIFSAFLRHGKPAEVEAVVQLERPAFGSSGAGGEA